ncbi:hypothetical protein Atai01_74530 [Amycolatopsis taiwanensis]|uniref:DUF3558 domain-containing protein n=1 Tax=Amycolatopsis taiwanensis TaxID=342230 RepID=A0A9W6R7J5_9PSEU|nr:hypothetical protein Atai01_74530 [Amycolatopsis taiwanensis]
MEGHTDQGELGGAGTSDCKWYKSSTNEVGGTYFGITVRPAQGLKNTGVTPSGHMSEVHTTGGREAGFLKMNEGEGPCVLAVLEIAVGSGRVDLNAETGTTDDACSVVSKLSDVVEPKLPAS